MVVRHRVIETKANNYSSTFAFQRKMLAKIFANNCVKVAMVHVNDMKRQAPKLAKWGLPLVIGGEVTLMLCK